MDLYFGSGIDDLVVPKDGGFSDRLPSPDSWSKWGIGALESFPSHNKRCAFNAKLTAEEEASFNGGSLWGEVEMEDFVHDEYKCSSSSGCGGESILASNRPDYQLDLAGSGQMDDIFLSSLLGDLPGIENLDKPFCFSPKSHYGMLQSDNFLKDTTLDSQHTSSDEQSLGSSRYLKTHAFSPSLGSEKEDSSTSKFVACNLQQKDFTPINEPSIEVSIPTRENNTNRVIDEETSLEEAVLQELKMVMNQLTEKTRISFRDALYRLANNSKQHHMRQNQDGEQCAQIPPSWTPDPETMRSGTQKATESETNVLDRAIANLMFNKMDFNVNVRDLPLAASSNSNSKEEISEVTEPSNYQSYTSPVHHSNDNQIQLDDAQVPSLGQMNSYPVMANTSKCI